MVAYTRLTESKLSFASVTQAGTAGIPSSGRYAAVVVY